MIAYRLIFFKHKSVSSSAGDICNWWLIDRKEDRMK